MFVTCIVIVTITSMAPSPVAESVVAMAQRPNDFAGVWCFRGNPGQRCFIAIDNQNRVQAITEIEE